MTLRTSTCAPWAQPSDITEVDYTILDGTILAECLQAASDVLFDLSGRQFSGLCTDIVRPLPRILGRDHGRPIAAVSAWALGGGGSGYFSGGYMSGYGYSRFGWVLANEEELPHGMTIPSIDLGVYPLVSVEQVLIDGQPVDPTTYRVDDNRHLVRLADPVTLANPGWPVSQRIDLPSSHANTWQVAFTYGEAPPPMGVMACAELAYQLYLAVSPTPTGVSKLPARVTSIARQGMNAIILDPQIFLDKGLTGLIRCDLFLRAKNPSALRRRGTVRSPDFGRRVRHTG